MSVEVDLGYCASSYLMYRYNFNPEKSFYNNCQCGIVDISFPRIPVKSKTDLLNALRDKVNIACADGKAVLALSGGIDSPILARFVPVGTTAYTFRCVVPGKQIIDESKQAKHWADLNGLKHEIIDISWDDVQRECVPLMEHKGAPIHSIEAQIYIAAKRARDIGYKRLIFGENADIIYGGMNGLLSKDWLFGEFVNRYTYVMPYCVLKRPQLILEPFIEFEKNGHIDGHEFINKYFRQEALGTYHNACETAGIEFVGPYSETYLAAPLDYYRIRNGDTKYLVREVFYELYPGETIPQKIPMPRPTEEWLADWQGPTRPEFWPHCTDGMTGDQKWMVWALERFLNMIDP